jgi:hypothetical protein
VSDYQLVLVDVERIKDYILATRRLRQMRGASALLLEANVSGTLDVLLRLRRPGSHDASGKRVSDITAPGCEWELVFAGGGLAQVLFRDPGLADRFASEVKGEYYRRTRWVRAVTARVGLPRSALSGPGYGQKVREATLQIAELKAGLRDRPTCEPLVGGHLLRPCEDCAREPAEGLVKVATDDHRYLCGACRLKQERGKQIADEVRKGLEGSRADAATLQAVAQIELEVAEELHTRTGLPVELADDIGELAKVSRPEGYLAYIEADGDGMGDLLVRLETRDHYRIFSECLDRATRRAWKEACVEVLTKEFRGGVLPVSVLIAGGDDLLAMCSPRYALPLPNEFCKRFPEAFDEELASALNSRSAPSSFPVNGRMLSVSAGILIAHASFPFSEFQRLGKELQASAKVMSRNRRASGWLGAIDFEVSSASAIEHISALRRPGPDGRHPHCRPYAAGAELDALIQAARALREAPRSKVRALAEAVREGGPAGDRRFAITLGRMDDGFRAAVQKLLKDLGRTGSDLWVQRNGSLFSPIPDLVEVVELLW